MVAGTGAVKAAVFLDRDGVVNLDRGYVFRAADFEFVPGTFDAARRLNELGFMLVVVTNQSGIARGLYGEQEFAELTDWMNKEFTTHGAAIADVYFCPHHPSEGLGPYRKECRCRKPAPGLILDAARDLGINLGRSVLFGDKPSDLQAAQSAGIAHRVLLGTDGLEQPAVTIAPGLATARFRSLAEAVADEDMQALLARLARARATP